jgi:hypothetical protein
MVLLSLTHTHTHTHTHIISLVPIHTAKNHTQKAFLGPSDDGEPGIEGTAGSRTSTAYQPVAGGWSSAPATTHARWRAMASATAATRHARWSDDECQQWRWHNGDTLSARSVLSRCYLHARSALAVVGVVADGLLCMFAVSYGAGDVRGRMQRAHMPVHLSGGLLLRGRVRWRRQRRGGRPVGAFVPPRGRDFWHGELYGVLARRVVHGRHDGGGRGSLQLLW